MNKKDTLYFNFKKLVYLNENASKEIIGVILLSLIKHDYNISIINHFQKVIDFNSYNMNAQQCWWNTIHYYIYHDRIMYKIISHIVNKAKFHKIIE
jgi:hypothetical protein